MERKERVLVCERSRLEDIIGGQRGLLRGRESEAIEIILGNREFMPRSEAEENPAYKQIIPYAAVLRGGEVYGLRRLEQSGEARLHGRLSLGVGGHITARDGNTEHIITRGLMRELNEEIGLESYFKLRLCGLINDDTNEVGQVHLGLFYTLETRTDIEVRETDKLEGEWLALAGLTDRLEHMETWSQLITPALMGIGG